MTGVGPSVAIEFGKAGLQRTWCSHDPDVVAACGG